MGGDLIDRYDAAFTRLAKSKFRSAAPTPRLRHLPGMDGYYHYYRLVHAQDSGKVLEDLRLVFVELPKFKAKNLTEKKMQVLWLRFLTEIDRDGADDVSQDLLDNPQTGEGLA